MNHAKLKSLLVVGSLIAVLALGTRASAFEIVTPKTESGNTVIESNTTIHDTVFGTGNDVDIRGSIDHDALLAGKNVAIHQLVGNNVFAAGETVHISGQVMGDVYIAGQNIFIDDSASIEGDVIAAGDSVYLGGTIHGKVRAYGRLIAIHGSIDKDVVVGASEVSLSNNSVIAGSLTGNVTKPLVKDAGATVQGQTNLERTTNSPTAMPAASGTSVLFGLIFAFLVSMVGGILVTLIAPNFTERIRTQTRLQPMQAALVGLLATMALMPLFILSLAMIVTIPVAFFELSAFAAIMLLGHVFSALWIGDWASMTASKKYLSAISALALGTILYLVISMIPLIGMLFSFVAMIVGIGAILIDLWHHYLRPTTN